MFNQKNVLHAFVTGTAAGKTSGLISSYSDLTDGQIAFVNESNTAQSDISGVDVFRVAVRNGTSLLYSPWIKRTTITNARTLDTVAQTQQISYIGYNGSTGQFTPINSTNFTVNINMKSTLAEFGNKEMLKHGFYVSDSSATQPEMGLGLVLSLVKNFSREPYALIRHDLINSNALNTGYDFDGNCTVVNGESTISVTSTGTYNTGTAPAAGDYVRLGATTTTAVALTSSIYRIASASGAATNVLTLDRPVTEPSGTYATGSDYTEVVTAAEATAADYGIKMTGIAQSNFVPGVFNPYVVEFTLGLVNFDDSDTITYNTAAVLGKGTYAEVASLYWFAQGNWGKQNRIGVPPPTIFAPAVSGTAYNLMYWEYYNDDANYLGATPKSPGQIIIALADHTANNNTTGDVLQGDTTYFPTAAGKFANFT